MSKFNTDHAIRKGDVATDAQEIKIKGAGKYRTWTASMMLRASTLDFVGFPTNSLWVSC